MKEEFAGPFVYSEFYENYHEMIFLLWFSVSVKFARKVNTKFYLNMLQFR